MVGTVNDAAPGLIEIRRICTRSRGRAAADRPGRTRVQNHAGQLFVSEQEIGDVAILWQSDVIFEGSKYAQHHLVLMTPRLRCFANSSTRFWIS
ncbi:hypothetical protein Cob_v012421 [Colletotrichum orbiculare MAFF 240422]|uniref:Uncharacterized protein n=1 Tax=Colletotrichum orbiculare (strain 104-T / ATCC 96160 / CBS 514.97 / LARS 414 / MAFF 240422) TaxID=1213857 RepID=A0A484FCD6_COLOR|nr:hypothetical protein Cob_v012421 [Colletotrichum orbiculare MAFF 240422]